jgi:hypothetical protein
MTPTDKNRKGGITMLEGTWITVEISKQVKRTDPETGKLMLESSNLLRQELDPAAFNLRDVIQAINFPEITDLRRRMVAGMAAEISEDLDQKRRRHSAKTDEMASQLSPAVQELLDTVELFEYAGRGPCGHSETMCAECNLSYRQKVMEQAMRQRSEILNG